MFHNISEGGVEGRRITSRTRIQFPHKQKNNMKTTALTKIILTSTLAIAAAAFIAMPIRSSAADDLKGAERMVQLNSPNLGRPAVAVTTEKKGMACSNCRDEVVTTSTWAGKGAFQKTTVGAKHTCPDCKNNITTIGTGKAQSTQVNHACGNCKG